MYHSIITRFASAQEAFSLNQANAPRPQEDYRFTPLGATTLLSPVPVVMVSCRENGHDTPNILTVAWTGTVCTQPPMLSISVRRERFSYDKIVKSGEFYVNFPSQGMLKAADLCGVRSGRNIDKFAACALTPVYPDALSIAPAIAQAPVCIACRVENVIPLGSHDLILARIVQTYVQRRFIGEGGSLELERAQLVAYRHGDYVALGKKLGFFGFSVASQKVLKRRLGSGAKVPARDAASHTRKGGKER